MESNICKKVVFLKKSNGMYVAKFEQYTRFLGEAYVYEIKPKMYVKLAMICAQGNFLALEVNTNKVVLEIPEGHDPLEIPEYDIKRVVKLNNKYVSKDIEYNNEKVVLPLTDDLNNAFLIDHDEDIDLIKLPSLEGKIIQAAVFNEAHSIVGHYKTDF